MEPAISSSTAADHVDPLLLEWYLAAAEELDGENCLDG